jgi:hypothetical protein
MFKKNLQVLLAVCLLQFACVAYTSTLKVETSVDFYWNIRRHTPEVFLFDLKRLESGQAPGWSGESTADGSQWGDRGWFVKLSDIVTGLKWEW